MTVIRIALANLPYAASPDDSVSRAVRAIAEAGQARADIICFPECYVPGYRGLGYEPPPPDGAFLERAWAAVAGAARNAGVAVILGTERVVDADLRIAVLVIDRAGTPVGFQDKVQLDPSEDGRYSPGDGRRTFTLGDATVGVAICHEGWRYPETVRWPARHGAQIVFHPHFHPAEPGGFRPSTFADPANTFHEKAALCRAAENGCYFATVNYATAGSATTSAFVAPDGMLISYQPYGVEGLLIADLELDAATGLLATRLRPAKGAMETR